MKIVHIITGLNDGGAEAVLYNLCLRQCGQSHIVVSLMGPGKYGPLLEDVGIPVHYLDIPQRGFGAGGLVSLWRLLRRLEPDLVQTWMYHADLIGGVVARLAGVSAVYWGIHSGALDREGAKFSTIATVQLCSVLSRIVPSRIICCSERAAVANQALGYASSRFDVIPNGYDVNRFRPDPAERSRIRAALRISDDKPLLGMVGRFHPAKDHRNLISAFGMLKQHAEFRCVLVGTGMVAENAELTGSLEAHGIAEVTSLLGARDDIPAIMNALDLHVLSSATEAFPNVVCEAMSCGTPCITTDVGDAALIVGETGWVVPPREPWALAQAMQAALELRTTQRSWRLRQEACRERVIGRFSIERMVSAYESAWQASL